MKRTSVMRAMFAAMALMACCGTARALGEEHFGNAPLGEANYRDWPGVMPVVNHTSRVYHTWVNGNEHFYYRGDMGALNDALRKFAEVKIEGKEVVLRPGPGMVKSFDRKQTIAFGWNLHLVGGIARHLTTLKQGDKVWSPHPVLTIYVGENTDLRKLEIPKGLKALSVSDVKQRTREGLKSEDKTVRGWGTGVLAELDPYDTASRDAIAGLLNDEDNWVRLNAALALASFGRQARPTLPLLRNALESGDSQLKDAAERTISAIEQAEDRTAAERAHRETLRRIQRFIAQRKR